MDDLVAQMTLQNPTDSQWEHVVDSIRGLPRSRLPQLWAKLVEQLAMKPPPIRGDVSQDQWIQLCHAQYREVYRCALRDAGVDNENTLAPSSGSGGGQLDPEKLNESVERLTEALKGQVDSKDLVDKLRDTVTTLTGIGTQVGAANKDLTDAAKALSMDELKKEFKTLSQEQERRILDTFVVHGEAFLQALETSDSALVVCVRLLQEDSKDRYFYLDKIERLHNNIRGTYMPLEAEVKKISAQIARTIRNTQDNKQDFTDLSNQIQTLATSIPKDKLQNIEASVTKSFDQTKTLLEQMTKDFDQKLASMQQDYQRQIDQAINKAVDGSVDKLKTGFGAELTAMTSGIGEVKLSVDTLKSEIATLNTSVSGGLGVATSTEFTELMKRVDHAEQSITVLDNHLNAELAALTPAIKTLETSIVAKTQETQLETKTQMDAITKSIVDFHTELEAKITQQQVENQEALTKTTASLQALTQATEQMKQSHSALEAKVTRVESGVTAMGTQIGTIGGTVENMGTGMGKMAQTIESLSNSLTILDTKLSGNIVTACGELEVKMENRIGPIATMASNADRLTGVLMGRCNKLDGTVEALRRDVDTDHTIAVELQHQASLKPQAPEPSPQPQASPRTPLVEEEITADANTDMWKATWPVAEQQMQFDTLTTLVQANNKPNKTRPKMEYIGVLVSDDQRGRVIEYLKGYAIESLYATDLIKDTGPGKTALGDSEFDSITKAYTKKKKQSPTDWFVYVDKSNNIWVNKNVVFNTAIRGMITGLRAPDAVPSSPTSPTRLKPFAQQVSDIESLVKANNVIPASLLILGIDRYYMKHLSTGSITYDIDYMTHEGKAYFSGVLDGKFSMSIGAVTKLSNLITPGPGAVIREAVPPLLWDPDHFFEGFNLR